MYTMEDRTASVIIGASGSDQSIFIDGFRLKFKVTKFRTISKNKAIVEIWNLNETTRSKIAVDNVLTLRAGYREFSGVLFIGNVLNVEHNKTPPNVITKITVSDGNVVLRDTEINLSYSAGAGAKEILNDISVKFGIPIKLVDDISGVPEKKFQNGFSYAGSAVEALSTLCDFLGLEYSVQNNAFKIWSSGTTDKTEAINLTSETGLIGSPKKFQKKDEFGVELTGLKVRSALNHRIEPAGTLAVTSINIENSKQKFYNIDYVEFNGDTHGPDWSAKSDVYESEA